MQPVTENRKPIRVMCYGDSLTAGYYGSTSNYCPYASKLARRLGVHVDEVGMSGWRVDEMVANLDTGCGVDTFGKPGPGLAVQLGRQKYDVCILMAGTNDLAANRTADQILADLKTLHQHCHARGVRTVAISIPESRFISEAFFRIPASMRRKVNRGLNQWASTIPDKVLFVDMAAQVPYSEFSGNWHPDGLHMTRQGYNNFGEKLSSLIGKFVTGRDCPVQETETHSKLFKPTFTQEIGTGLKWLGSSLPMMDLTNLVTGSTAFLNAPCTITYPSPPLFSSLVLTETQGQGHFFQPIIW